MFVDINIPTLSIPTPGEVTARQNGTVRAAPPALAMLRERIAVMERAHSGASLQQRSCLSLGIKAIDQALPGGGLTQNALHETVSAGADTEHAAAATLFAAGLLARLEGPVLWVQGQADLFAPALAGVGLDPGRIVFVEADKDILPVVEEGLRHRGLAAVVGEPVGRISLVASRRLQLAAEKNGVIAMLIRRSTKFDDPIHHEPTAAFTRWRVTALPSSLSRRLGEPLKRARWQLDLTRCRGAETGSWIVEACDAKGRLGLVPDAADRSDQAA